MMDLGIRVDGMLNNLVKNFINSIWKRKFLCIFLHYDPTNNFVIFYYYIIFFWI